MTRVVLDTNTLFSALLFGGIPEAVLQLAKPPAEIVVLVSPFILGEIRRILETRSRLSRKEIEQIIMEDISELTECITPVSKVSALPLANPDNEILACAIDARAQFLITGDHELLKLRRFEDVSIVTPREFLATLGGL